MISHSCPICKTENTLRHTFRVQEYICKSCNSLVDTDTQRVRGKIAKPTSNVVLDIANKGTIDGKEYTVVAIVVRKYGASTYWREYFLKDHLGNNAFLSESDGHWIFLLPQKIPLKDNKYWAEFNGKKYRWFETTPSNVHSASGFFEEGLSLSLSNYKEFVNGSEMISRETNGKADEFFWGKHIPKSEIKRAFKPSYMPNYYGIGIVQPFYYNVKQMLNIVGISAILMCLIYLYNYLSRTNYQVFNETLKFEDVHNKEYVSNSFELHGGSAPLEIKAYSNVDNSWANIELNLVNEDTNEIHYTTKDIEKYHGFTDGESWSEGSQYETFNFCGIPAGKYHFEISAQKQGYENMDADLPANQKILNIERFTSKDGSKTFVNTNDGWVDVIIIATGDRTAYNLSNIRLTDQALADELEEHIIEANSTSYIRKDFDMVNPNVEIKAFWKPVTFWNLGILLFLMTLFVILSYIGKYYFERSKWSNSSNSPYPEEQ